MACLLACFRLYHWNYVHLLFCLRGLLCYPFSFLTPCLQIELDAEEKNEGIFGGGEQMEAETHEPSLPGCRADMKYNDFTLFEF
jgi:hypothetical protein